MEIPGELRTLVEFQQIEDYLKVLQPKQYLEITLEHSRLSPEILEQLLRYLADLELEGYLTEHFRFEGEDMVLIASPHGVWLAGLNVVGRA